MLAAAVKVVTSGFSSSEGLGIDEIREVREAEVSSWALAVELGGCWCHSRGQRILKDSRLGEMGSLALRVEFEILRYPREDQIEVCVGLDTKGNPDWRS